MSDETIHPFVRGLLERAKFDDGRFEFTSDDERTIVDALAALGTTPQLAELAMELTTLAHWLRTEQNNEVAADLVLRSAMSCTPALRKMSAATKISNASKGAAERSSAFARFTGERQRLVSPQQPPAKGAVDLLSLRSSKKKSEP